MAHKKAIVLSILYVLLNTLLPSQVALASSSFLLPYINNVLTGSSNSPSAPSVLDYVFDDRGLTVRVNSNSSGGYSLNVTGAGNFSFYGTNVYPIAGTATSYSLIANFTSTGTFLQSGSNISIQGTLLNTSALPIGISPPTTTNLFSANLTGFGFNTTQGDLGFNTSFAGSSSWATNQSILTGGSAGESIYLIDQAALIDGGYGRLTQLVNAFAAGNLSTIAGASFVGVESVAAVPLPIPLVLYVSGITSLMLLSSKRKNIV
jgi:hypothetical protein